ncbi:MAG: transcription-repair coupling factor, partial [Planctomycetaceae bacterium]
MATATRRAIANLTDLTSLLAGAEGFADVRAAMLAGNSAGIDGAWGSACALCVAALAETQSPGFFENPGISRRPLLVVLPRIADVDEFALDVANFLGAPPEIFPAWESLPQERSVNDAVFGGRLRVLQTLSQTPGFLEKPGVSDVPGVSNVIVTCIAAVLQPVPGRDVRRSATRTLTVGDELDRDEFLRWLVDRGFERTGGVDVPGEFCVHGGILDVYPPDADDPFRIEFFGDAIESIRRFDAETQRKVRDVTTATFALVAPQADEDGPDGGESLFDSLPPESWVVLTELEELVDEGNLYLDRLSDPRGLFGVSSVLERAARFPHAMISAVAAAHETACRLQVESIERFSGPKSAVLEELARVVAEDEQVLVACHNDGERQRLAELLAEFGPPLSDRVSLCIGRIARGFRLVAERTLVLGDHELFGRRDVRRVSPRKRKLETRAIDSFLDLRPGDLVVHLSHGIGRYRGMKLLEKAEQQEEHLMLEFRDRVHVYVPVSLIHLVQKYVGAAKAVATLSKLGGTTWSKRKQRVAEAVTDMAADMIRLQAARESRPGIACPPDSHFQDEFEASFPYTETDDQLDAIRDLKTDMQMSRPMDRLICGDVGYGKTEVAMRAAFKAVEAGRQVAVLVPTTVLAEQHFRTFTERMAEYPVNIDVISRFRSKAEQRDILAAARTGGVDILIGTHRLVQKDVQFKDLGLLVIDEEQRFGVEAKEMLKRLRLEVDVLTLSATPIPRTLHMSLLGVRDISNLTTAPQDRQSIETRICRFDGELVRRAVIRELNRNGQVFFVHNRVYNIRSIADRIQSLVPEARIGIGHGQMPEGQLESAMVEFVSGRTDVLVCTTIIESGLDIPNANTIFINLAGIFGLADLHQLRGRVGRYKHRAYLQRSRVKCNAVKLFRLCQGDVAVLHVVPNTLD